VARTQILSQVTYDDGPDPRAVLAAFGLAGPVTGWTAVAGAWSNRLFRLDAAGSSFAVKQLRNPWQLAGWREWLAESWSFELAAIAAGVAAPRPVANPGNGDCVADVRLRDGTTGPVRVHQWVHGRAFRHDVVTPETARWAGLVLATLHRLAIKPRDRSVFPQLNTDNAMRWGDLTEHAHHCGAGWADLMTAAATSVADIADLARSAGRRPDEEIMSHGDIDQKNLIASAAGPVLCDWDVALPLVPRRELADVAMSLSCWRDFTIAREVVRSYRASGGDDAELTPPDLGQPMMVGLDWVALNVERALGLRTATEAEVATAARLLPALLAAIPAELATALRVTDMLHGNP
jgi:hypothetical protein